MPVLPPSPGRCSAASRPAGSGERLQARGLPPAGHVPASGPAGVPAPPPPLADPARPRPAPGPPARGPGPRPPRPWPAASAGTARTSRAPEVALPQLPARRAGVCGGSGVSYGQAVQSECNTRGFRGAGAAPPLSRELRPTATFDDGSRGACAPLLANQEPRSPGRRRWQPVQARGSPGRKPPVTSRGRESSPAGANEEPGKTASASSSANPGRGRGQRPRRFRIRGRGPGRAANPSASEAGPEARQPIGRGSGRARARRRPGL